MSQGLVAQSHTKLSTHPSAFPTQTASVPQPTHTAHSRHHDDQLQHQQQYIHISNVAHAHTAVLRPFFRDHPGEPVPEKNFWTLWCKRRLTEADTPTIRLGATPSGVTSARLHHHPPNVAHTPPVGYSCSKHISQTIAHCVSKERSSV